MWSGKTLSVAFFGFLAKEMLFCGMLHSNVHQYP